MSVQAELRAQMGPEYKRPKVVVWFEDAPRRDVPRTEKEGRPCYTTATFYCERNPKDRFTQVKRVATDEDYQNWPEAYEHYLAIHEMRKKPRVDFLPDMDVGTVKEMNAIEVYTLEDLLANDLPEWAKWRDMARRVLDALDGKAPAPAPAYTGMADFSMEMSL